MWKAERTSCGLIPLPLNHPEHLQPSSSLICHLDLALAAALQRSAMTKNIAELRTETGILAWHSESQCPPSPAHTETTNDSNHHRKYLMLIIDY